MIEQLYIAGKMARCATASRNLFKESYAGKIKSYKDILQAVMMKEELGEIEALLFVCEAEEIKYNGLALMLFVSAAFDLIES